MESGDRSLAPEVPPLPAGPFLFVSYASVDRERVLTVADGLRGAGLELWIDQAGIAGGAAYGTEIATALKESAAVALMCSAASLASRNVRQEIMLAWRYDRPILPLLLEPTAFPDDVAYWLEGAQWIEVLDRPAEAWLPLVGRALRRHGLDLAQREPEPERRTAPRAGGETAAGITGNLPPADDALIGREREVREVLALLGQGRWVTLIGSGGIGKTRLALEVARRSAANVPDGAWVVDLAAITNAEAVPPAIADALGISEQPGQGWLDLLAAGIGDRRLLVLLDNVEQVADGAAAVSRLVDRCAGLTVLATSRIPLQSPYEWVYAVAPFSLPDLHDLPPLPVLAQNPAIQLFVERARAARPDFVLSDGLARPVAEICHRLDGLPLAIELAAARVRLLTPAAILTRLGSRLNLLTRGAGANARQQTLRDTIAWSFGLLSPSEQSAFRRLAVFAGGATVEAGEAVMRAVDQQADAVLDDIAALVDHSLLRVEHHAADDTPRVRMLETIREYASEQLEASGEHWTCRTAHARYFLNLALVRRAELRTPRPGTALAALRAENDNLRTALDWLAGSPDPDRADAELTLAAALVGYWRLIGRYEEAASRLTGALRRVQGGDPDARAWALQGLGFLAMIRGDFASAETHYQSALALRQEGGDRAGEADVLHLLAEVAEGAGNIERFKELAQQVLVIRRELGDEVGLATATHSLGLAALYQGDFARAIDLFGGAIARFRNWSDARNLANALSHLTAAEMLSGAGDPVTHAEESLALWRTLDDRYAIAYAVLNHGRALQLTGRHDEAIPVLEAARAECDELGDPSGVSLALYGLGLIALDRGDIDLAAGQLAESLRLSHELDEKWHIAERLEALAAVWMVRDEARRAARLLGAAAGLREAGGFPVPPAEQPALERTTGALAGLLGTDGLAGEMAAGREAALDVVLADALGEDAV